MGMRRMAAGPRLQGAVRERAVIHEPLRAWRHRKGARQERAQGLAEALLPPLPSPPGWPAPRERRYPEPLV